MTPMLAKFPFTADASAEASIGDVAAMLAPGTGALWAFQQERLDPLMEKQGAQWVPKPGAPVVLSAPFLAFFNRAAAVSAALFGGAPEPRVVLTARGIVTPQVSLITLSHGSYVARFTRDTPPAQFVWPPQSGRDARLIARLGKRDLLISEASGDWAFFRLVSRANRADGSGGSLRAEWTTPSTGGVPVTVEFAVPGGYPVLQRGGLGGMSCVAQVTR
jgi:type VI secretion system protein ImpL